MYMCLSCVQLVDKLNTDSNISDMQMDYSDVCYTRFSSLNYVFLYFAVYKYLQLKSY